MSTVTTQAELDAALAAKEPIIYIESDPGVWLTITHNNDGSSRVEARGSSRVVAWESSRVVARGSSRVVAWESSRVEARGSSSVEARGSSSVEARGSSRVVAWESSSVEARGSSRVVAWESSSVVAWESSRVEARGSSSVEARGSSRVVAWGSSRVVAWESSSVEARGSSSVEARGSSRVEARGSSSVVAWESSRVEAAKYTSVHLFSKTVKLDAKGAVIDLTDLDLNDRETWIDYRGVKIRDGKAVVYKAVDSEFRAGFSYTITTYEPGSTVTAPDWKPTRECGHGLHFGHRPEIARGYYGGAGEPVFLECLVDAVSLIALGDKCKAESCEVVRVVDIHGDAIEVPAVAA